MLILVAFSYITSLLLDVKLVSQNATLDEDLAYFSEHILSQKISAYTWLATALFTAIAIPFYLAVFRRRLRVLQYLNGLFMLAASAAFVMMAKYGMEMNLYTVGMLETGMAQTSEQVKLTLLEQFSQEQFYRLIGSSFVGLWAIGLSLTKFKLERFPLISSLLLFLSGPALLFFNWTDPDHLGRTFAMAGIIIGVMVFCVRMINKGMEPS